VYAVLAEDDIYPPLRDTLILLLAFAFVTVLATILLNARNDSRRKSAYREEATSRPTTEAPHTPSRAPSPTGTSPPPAPAPETHASPAEQSYEEVNVEEIEADGSEPGTLFNPATGLSFRSHLDRKLGLELERAAYNDQDLSCILIAFDGIGTADEYVERARNVLDAFQFEDLCFEFGPKSFFVILPNTELPQAIRQAAEFKKRYRASAMGLSARNGRLVESGRVVKEAEGSLGHARKHDSRIVGFRPDPRKYRQFVSEQLGNEE
jgi:GGDEF domain-containing protein